jgi:hypothetical protein
MQLSELVCSNGSGGRVNFFEKNGFIILDTADLEHVNLDYKIKVGELGKHGHRGDIEKDMFTFDGEEALLLPSAAYSGTDGEIKKETSSVEIQFDVPTDWQAAIPFPTERKSVNDKFCSKISSLTWSKFYDIRKACYALGKFETKTYQKNKGLFTVYLDSNAAKSYTTSTETGLNALYDYYVGLFGYGLPDLSIIIFGKDSEEDSEDDSYIIGGASTKTIGSTFDPNAARDWELMGHRLCHAFFDTKMKEAFFHIPPQTWFYEGLVTYYENCSMSSLPEEIKKSLNLGDEQSSFLSLYKRYMYMRLKDPNLFSIVPMNEAEISKSGGLNEYLDYTQAPLVVKAIEDMHYKRTGTKDALLKYILNNVNKNFTLQDIIQSVFGTSEANVFAKNYLFGKEILPLWYLADGNHEDVSETVKELNDYEYLLWTWFHMMEDGIYPEDKLTTEGLDRLSDEADKLGVHFEEADMEKKVENLSPAAYKLLKQYYLRASVCGVDKNDSQLRFKILGNEDYMKKWNYYISSIKSQH